VGRASCLDGAGVLLRKSNCSREALAGRVVAGEPVYRPNKSLEPTPTAAALHRRSRAWDRSGWARWDGRAAQLSHSAAALSPKQRGRLAAERPGGIRQLVVGSRPVHYYCTALSKIVNGDGRAARPAPPPNRRMNPPRYFMIGLCSGVKKFTNRLLLVCLTRDAGYPPGR
jgi:hypothetical protein